MASLGLEAIEAYKVWCRQHGFSAALSKTWQERRQERAAHQRNQQAAQAEDALRQHVAQLGLDGVAAYQAWCRQQGLGDAVHKSDAQRSKELKLHQQVQSTQALHKGRKHSRRTKDIIHQLWAGAIAEEELRTEVLHLIHRAFAGLAGDQRGQLRDLLLHVEKRAPNLLDARPALHRLGRVDGNTFVEALGALARHSDAWQAVAVRVEARQPQPPAAIRRTGPIPIGPLRRAVLLGLGVVRRLGSRSPTPARVVRPTWAAGRTSARPTCHWCSPSAWHTSLPRPQAN